MNFFSEIEEWKRQEFKNIYRENTFNKNHCFAFTNLGDFGELLTLLLFPRSIGSASKGGCSFDNTEINGLNQTLFRREVKFCSLDGSKICLECKKKLPRFQEKCIYCNNTTKFQLQNDSRCGISAKSTIKYKDEIKEHILFVSKYMVEDNYIKLFCYKINTSNEYFMEYNCNQYEKGKTDTCNLLPFSRDFHLSGPIMILEMNLYKDTTKVEYFNLLNETISPIPLRNWNTGKIIKYSKEEKQLFHGKNCIDYKENISKFSQKKKAFGKDRGEVLRK
jgi:hypothetical protein